MTLFQQIAAALNWNLRVNENFVSVSPAGLYGRNPATTTGLTWGYLGGNFNGVAVATGTVALTASNNNYVVAHRTTGVVSAAVTTTNWLNTGTYLQLYMVTTGASTVTLYDDMRQAFGGSGSSSFTGGTLTTSLNEAPAVTIASSATVNIGAAAANTIKVTGTTTITAFDSIADGAARRVIFSGILTLTHNATSLILPSAANITTAAGDVADFVSLGSGNWRCTNYMRASGLPVASSGGSGDVVGPASSAADSIAVYNGTTGKLLKDGGKTIAALRAPAVQSVASSATVTPTFADDIVLVTAQAAGLTLANLSGTAIDGLGIVIRVKDNGAARSIAYGTQYRAIGVTLPTTTVISKTLYLAGIWNATDTKLDIVAVGQEA